MVNVRSEQLVKFAQFLPPGDPLKRVTVVLPVDVHKALKFKSINDDKTMNDLILTAIQQYLSPVKVQIEQSE